MGARGLEAALNICCGAETGDYHHNSQNDNIKLAPRCLCEIRRCNGVFFASFFLFNFYLNRSASSLFLLLIVNATSEGSDEPVAPFINTVSSEPSLFACTKYGNNEGTE